MIIKEGLFVGVCAIAMIVAGCERDKPPQPENVKSTSNIDYSVARLFTDESGCVVHRFGDAGHYHYYVTCPDSRQASTQTDYSYRVGKATHYVHDNVSTLYK